mgnify:CR=1 FL=1
MIKVILCDDHALIRRGIRDTLSDAPDIEVVGEADSGETAYVRYAELKPDVVVMDLSMPGQSGLDALAMLRAKAPDMGILILSGYPETHYATTRERVLAAVETIKVELNGSVILDTDLSKVTEYAGKKEL